MDPRERRTTKLTQYGPIARRQGGPLLLVGATVRAAAQALTGKGWQVIAADAFGDRDTRSAALRTHVARPYPAGLLGIVRRYPGVPWCYLGALENRPDWLSAWARHAPLWGIPDPTVRALRDPWSLQAILRKGGVSAPPLLRRAAPGGSHLSAWEWLHKPRHSGGGRRIHFESEGRGASRSPSYRQAFIHGIPRSGVFVACQTHCRLIGVTGAIAEIDATTQDGCSPFHYSGSWGPIPLTTTQQEWWERLGSLLTRAWRLRGVFGVDAVWTGDNFVVLEVNPRWTASAEVLERTSGVCVLGLHVEQFCSHPSASAFPSLPAGGPIAAKQVLYAPAGRRVTDAFVQWCEQPSPTGQRMLADIPEVGSDIRQGSPVLTVFADGASVDGLRENLRRQCRQVWMAWERQPFV